jgi:hypothetical protein
MEHPHSLLVRCRTPANVKRLDLAEKGSETRHFRLANERNMPVLITDQLTEENCK